MREDREEHAMEMTEEEIAEDFPNGLPEGWEAIKQYEFETKKK